MYSKSSNLWSSVFDIANSTKRIKILEKISQKPDFWENKKEATETQKELSALKDKVGTVSQLEKEINDINELAHILSSTPEDTGKILKELTQIENQLEEKTKELLLRGTYDNKNAILSVQSGAGGRDADDWAAMVFEMYQKYCNKENWQFKIIAQSFAEAGGPDGRIGLREGTMVITSTLAYGVLKKESGVHRLVRISPFSAKKLRHTSFCKVSVLPKLEEVDFPKIDQAELKIETFRSAGKGGQNVNKRETAIRITHIPTGLTAASQEQRQQAQNRKSAMSVLASKLLAKKQEEKREELQGIKGDKIPVDFGQQIRSYVLHPYKLVKDHRTKIEVSDTESVLNGDLNEFIDAELMINN